jgi:hypothetical protein
MMVAMYVNGAKVGTLDENPNLFKQLVESGYLIEFRSDNGTELGTFLPKAGAICGWEVGLTREEIDRRVKVSKRSNLNEILTRLGAV